jgi:TonB family protein
MNLDFSRAVNITWNRKDRNRLPLLHHEICEAARIWGLDQLYRLAVLAFAGTGGRPRDRLEILAQGARQAGDYFPFSAGVMASMRSFVPTKLPSSNQLQDARAAWSGGVANARSSTVDNSSRGVKPIEWRRVAFGPEIKPLPKEVRDQWRNLNTTKQTLEAANLAGSAALDSARSSANHHSRLLVKTAQQILRTALLIVALLTTAEAEIGATPVKQAMALCTYAPRPQYPYEARSKHITGRGVCVVDVDLRTGLVTKARMVRRTGSPILDNATLAASRQWRFRPGDVSRVYIPITFTMKGVSY